MKHFIAVLQPNTSYATELGLRDVYDYITTNTLESAISRFLSVRYMGYHVAEIYETPANSDSPNDGIKVWG